MPSALESVAVMDPAAGTITLEEWHRRNRRQIAAMVADEYGDAGPGADPVIAEYGRRPS